MFKFEQEFVTVRIDHMQHEMLSDTHLTVKNTLEIRTISHRSVLENTTQNARFE